MSPIVVPRLTSLRDLGADPIDGLLVFVTDLGQYYTREREQWLQVVWALVWLPPGPGAVELFATLDLAHQRRDETGGVVQRMLVQTRVES